MRLKSILMALLIPFLLTACGQTDRERIDAAAQAISEARVVDVWPDFPADCRRISRSGIRHGDRLDVAVLKADEALARQNNRALRCAGWYDQQRADAAKAGAQ